MPRDNRNPHFLWIEEQRDIQNKQLHFISTWSPLEKGPMKTPWKNRGEQDSSGLRVSYGVKSWPHRCRRQGTGRWRMKDELGGSPHVFLLTIFFFWGGWYNRLFLAALCFWNFLTSNSSQLQKICSKWQCDRSKGFKWCGWASKNLENPQDFLVRLPSQTLTRYLHPLRTR